MCLRTTKRRNADGSEARYFQLAENLWDPAKGCAVAKVVYNFGRAETLDHESLRRLPSVVLRKRPIGGRWCSVGPRLGAARAVAGVGRATSLAGAHPRFFARMRGAQWPRRHAARGDRQPCCGRETSVSATLPA